MLNEFAENFVSVFCIGAVVVTIAVTMWLVYEFIREQKGE